MSGIAERLKKRPGIYSTVKVARDIAGFPLTGANGLRALPSIWRVYPRTMLPAPRLYNICDAVGTINREGVPGDIIECGVWSGGALALAALWDMRTGDGSRRYFGADSFEGLPPPTTDDGDVYTNFNAASERKGRKIDRALMRTGVCVGDAADTVRQFFFDLGIPPERTTFLVGWFQKTLPRAQQELSRLAILRIDGDWYDSTKVCFDRLYAAVSPGGYVIVDDYGCFSGCRKAVDEFRGANDIDEPLTWVDEHCVWWRKRS